MLNAFGCEVNLNSGEFEWFEAGDASDKGNIMTN